MITPYLSQQPVDDFGSRFAGLLYSATVAASSDTSLTIPGTAPTYKALIKAGANAEVWVALNATAAVPVGGSFAASTSELVTVDGYICREVRAGDVLHFFTAAMAGASVSVVLYAIGTPN